MIAPAFTVSPPYAFTPRYCGLLSRPFRDDPPPLFVAISSLSTDVAKAFQPRSRIAPRLNVPNDVRLATSLAAALPEELFHHPYNSAVSIAVLRSFVKP